MAFDVVGGKRSRQTADSLVGLGILSAVPTAVTGLSELADTSDRKERSLAAAHAIGNVAALLLYSFSYVARKRGRRGTGILYSTTGWGTVLASGFLGGHLAFRKGVGVDRTRFDHRVTDWTSAIRDEDLPEAKPTKVSVGRTDVLLYREDGRIHAVAARCSHRGGPLHKGRVQDLHVTCPWHLSTFDLRDGSIVRGPATAPQPAYEVRVKDGTIEVRTPPD
jgi:nitrite reductase/ring-hydroxylating ferredoxin subunit